MSPTRRATRLLLVALCACSAPVDTSWHDESGYRWRALDVHGASKPGFESLSPSSTRITHRNDVDDEHALANRNLLIGAGAAIGDIDGDGLPDLFLASVERPAALYHNDGDLRFTDVTASSGLGTRDRTLSAAFVDVNGDRNLDLVIGTLGGPIELWIGDGHGHFSDSTATSGFTGGLAATALTFADVDGDGHLDLYVGTYKVRSALDAYPPEARTFDAMVKKVGDTYVLDPKWSAEYRIEDRPDLGGVMRSQRADVDLFYVNDGRGHFARTAISGARFRDESGHPLAHEPDYFTLAARFYDANGDGAPDLYVCNDFEDPDQFWLNDGHGGFRLAPWRALRATSNTCMSVDFADVDRDGNVDFFTADMMSPTLAERQRQLPTHMPLPKKVGLTDDRQQWMRNMLQLSRGDGTWFDASDAAGVEASDWTWGSAFLDVDLDGYEDLLTASGHRWDVRDAATFERLRAKTQHTTWNREQGEFPRLATHSIAYRNRGDLTFENASRAWRFGADSSISQGIALGDLDGDGDLDVVITRLDDTPVILKNETGAPRIAVRLHGVAPNTEGVGARVTVRAGSLPTQSREMTAGGYYLSGSDAALAFAAGNARDSSITIEVRWRSGRTSTIQSAHANRLYVIDEAQATVAPPPRDTIHALFADATSLLQGHTHVDSIFDDYRRQPLLPTKFSQLGPGVSWIDVDADGREDLVVGTGRGGQLAVLRNAGNRFTLERPPGDRAALDLTMILPAPAARAGRDMVLLAGQSNYETTSPSAALSAPSVLELPLHNGTPGAPHGVTPGDTASVGPMALGDVNGDGRLDLFVGARVIPGVWPLPAPSRIYLRTADGAWVRDTADARVLSSLGLVSAALFVDLDGDGQDELVTTAEWGPVRVLRCEAGQLRDVTKEWGLSDRTSRWNGLASGDFDGDGRLDLIVTSWGRNIPWRASPDRPYELILGNFGGGGIGLVFAQRDSATGKEMPLESYERIVLAVPSVRDRLPTFGAYARATIDDVLGEAGRGAVRVGATTFDHLVLLNRGDHFEPHALPGAAQLAPAFAPVVTDFNGDGREDLFLSQNFFPTETGTQRFDAGAGLLLLGDGKGGFVPLTVQQSGIHVYGDQRGAAAADYDGDGRVDLAVSQNGGPTTLWHNEGARPGVRVRLHGPPDNPLGVGARIRWQAGTGRGPLREVHAGSGYWSMDAATMVLAPPANATAIWVRWPDGKEQTVPLPEPSGTRTREVVVTR